MRLGGNRVCQLTSRLWFNRDFGDVAPHLNLERSGGESAVSDDSTKPSFTPALRQVLFLFEQGDYAALSYSGIGRLMFFWVYMDGRRRALWSSHGSELAQHAKGIASSSGDLDIKRLAILETQLREEYGLRSKSSIYVLAWNETMTRLTITLDGKEQSHWRYLSRPYSARILKSYLNCKYD